MHGLVAQRDVALEPIASLPIGGDVHRLADRRLIAAEVVPHPAERDDPERDVDRAVQVGAIFLHDAKPRNLDAQRGDELVVAFHRAMVTPCIASRLRF